MEVHPEVAALALERVRGFEFEDFVNDLYPRIVGLQFVPLGGMHDGGADAYFGGDPVHERIDKPNTFCQASVTAEWKPKIRQTVKRHKEFGREVKFLTYVTSRDIQAQTNWKRS